MKYWDASALVALIIEHESTASLRRTSRADTAIATWWATSIECMSAVTRKAREERLTAAEVGAAAQRLRIASARWTEVGPSPTLREQAFRLLRVHPLRAADALQLAAAIVASDFQPGTLDFVTLDARLAEAADAEGFHVVM